MNILYIRRPHFLKPNLNYNNQNHPKPMKKSTFWAVCVTAVLFFGLHQTVWSQVVISQVYGGGGNSGAPYKNDFIELFNRGTATVVINGWSVQYASATGSSWTNSTPVPATPAISLAPGQYYLIQGSGGTVGAALPTPDLIGTINLSGTAGKVALVNTTTALSGSCPTGATIIDFVGFGATASCFEGTAPTPAPSNTTSVSRANAGCTDANNNSTDFTAGAPNPRNTATALNVCGGPPTPTITLSTATLSSFTYVYGAGPSAEQSFTVSGINLTDAINLTPPTDYEISTGTGGTFSATNPITLPQSSGSVATTTIHVRLKGGLAVGTYSTAELINAASAGATAQTVTCTGSVTSVISPVITVGSLVDFGSQTINTLSAEQTYNVSGTNLTAGIIITAPAGFQISTGTGALFVSSSPITLPLSGSSVASTPIYVKFAPTLAQAYTGVITHTSTGATQQDVSVSGTGVNAITNPVAQSIPYVQDFSSLAWASSTYPDGWQGWTISTVPAATFNTAAPIADKVLTPSATAAGTSGLVNNYNGAIGFQNTGSLDLTVALAINTTGASNVLFAYDIMAIRNPYDGGSNTRINEVTLQYRVGTSGVFTSLTGIEYQNNTVTQTGAVTTPQNLVTKSITLPSACDNQAVVQLRWASRQVSGAGSRPSFAVDNISVTSGTGETVASPTFTPPAGNYMTTQSVTISSTTPGAVIHYTTNGNEPNETSPTAQPISVSATTTIKAKAYATGMTASATVTALYKFPVTVSSIAALRAGLQDGTVYKLTSEAIVTYQRPDFDANQLWLKDATGAIVTYDVSGFVTTDYVIGDGVTGITGTLSTYNGLLELIPTEGADPGAPTSTGHVITPLPRTLASLSLSDESQLVSIPFVSFTPAPGGNFVVSTNYTIADAVGTGVLRTLFVESDYIATPTPIPTIPQNMVALVGRSNAIIQITPRFSADMVPFAPLWTSGWPKADGASQTVFTARVNIADVPGTAYFVVLPNTATAPTSLQVKNGQDQNGVAVPLNMAGTIPCAAGNTEYTAGVTGLTPNTPYKVYFVAEAYTTLQAAPVLVTISTTLSGTAPVVIQPTATSITNTTALLGGNITSDGGQALIEKGTVWSLTTPVLATDNKLAASGTATGIFTHTRSSLPPATLIHFAAYAKNAIGTTLSTEGTFYTLANEPTNHATGFAAGTTTTTTIPLTWVDATGTVTPNAYLIKGSNVSYAAITDPVDGVAEADAALVHNVNQGVQNYTFTGLTIGTPYYFKIYPYTISGAISTTINYKTSVPVPQATATTLSSTTYTWQGADNGLWTAADNWTPSRTTPDSHDILVFNDNTTKTVTGLPAAETIGQLVLSGTTTVNLQSSVPAALTIGGLTTGADLVVPAGCALNFTAIVATNTITMTLAAGATGDISGNMSFTGLSSGTVTTAHRLLTSAANVIALTFNSGATFTAGLNFIGNAFGGSSAPVGFANSVSFANGSTYIHFSGSNPFGLTQPASVVIFQPGSLYKVTGNVTPAFSGRTYADLEINSPGNTITTTGGAAVSMNNLTVTAGTLNFSVTTATGHSIKGNIIVATGAALNFSPGSSATVNLNGTAAQTISGDGTITGNTNSNLVIANSAGITLNANVSIAGMLTLNNSLTLGTGNLTLGSAAALSGTFSASNMIIATNTGELRKAFAADGAYTFPVGDNDGTAEYSPVTLTFSGGGTYTSAYAGVNLKNNAFLGVSGNHLNRYWNVSSSGITSTCNAQFNYVPADVVGTESEIYCFRVAPTVDPYNVANTSLHQLTANGLTSFGTFTGRPQVSLQKTLNLTSLFLEGLYNPTTGTMNQAAGHVPPFAAGIADQVTIELHNSTTPATIEFTAENVDLSTAGAATITTIPGTLNDSYYITIKHRNSVETTSIPVSFASSTIDVAFTQANVYGAYLKSISGTFPKFVIYTGDVNQDKGVGVLDLGLVDNKSKIFATGYLVEDIDGDGSVGVLDLGLIDNNSKLFVASHLPY